MATVEEKFDLSIEALLDRLLPKFEVNSETGCWEWIRALKSGGYGQLTVNKVAIAAHRLSYMIFVGPIPEGLVLDHLCRVRHCVNPKHLEPVTVKENTNRGIQAERSGCHQRAKTHCPQGHPYADENLYVQGGARVCRTCKLARGRAAYARRAEAAA